MPVPPFPERRSPSEVEAGAILQPKFGPDGLIPCITVDAASGEVAMLAFMNEAALRHTLETGRVTYWSRSRNRLWVKGEESGHFQLLRELRVDCDQDVILVTADLAGGASCHTGYKSCFYRRVADPATLRLEFTEARRAFDPASVYRK